MNRNHHVPNWRSRLGSVLIACAFVLLSTNTAPGQGCGGLITYFGGQGTWSDSCTWGLALGCYPTNGNCFNPGSCTIPPGAASIEDHWRVQISSTGTPGINSLVLDTSVTLCELQLLGGTIWALLGPEDLTVESEFLWSEAQLSGSGTTTSEGDLTIFGPVNIWSREFVNNGDGVLNGAMFIDYGIGPTSFTNSSGATFELAGDGGVWGSYSPIFINDGLLTKTGSGFHELRILIDSPGPIDVEAGTLRLADLGGTLGGDTEVFGGATLELNGGGGTEYVFAPGSSVTGAGSVVNTGYLSSDAFWDVGQFTMSAGVADFTMGAITFDADISGGTITGDFQVDGWLTWTGGGLGAGEAWVAGGTVDGGALYGRTFHVLPGGTFIIHGLPLMALNGATIVNEVDAVVDLSTELFVPFGQSAFFENHGTFLKTGTLVGGFGADFTNHGLVEITDGTLTFASYTQVAGVTHLAGGTLAGGAPVVIDGGRLTGTGLLNASVINNGSIEPAGEQAAGIIEVGYSLTLEAASELRLELGGTTPGTEYDVIAEPAYTITLDGYLYPSFFGGFDELVESGDEFVVVESLNLLDGVFANVLSGNAVATADGHGFFTCHYGPGSPFHPGQVVLTDFEPAQLFLRGDANGDGIFSGLVDGMFILAYQFQGGPIGPCFEAMDTDGDGVFNGIVDAIYVFTHAFLGGPPPPAPYPQCGFDPDLAHSLGCDSGPGCP